MMKLFKILFFNSMMMGTFISISSHSWFSAWMGLEINLLSFIPLLMNKKNKFPAEATLKYFIAQVMGSSLIMFSITIFLISNDPLTNKLSPISTALLASAFLLKMGAAPLHWWLPEVMSGLSWTNNFILMTWQKISPIVLVSYLMKPHSMFFSIIIITSSMISGLMGLNQICLRKIMAYSSMNHISWMISSLLNSTNICGYYFIMYCLINMNILLILKYFNIFFLNQLTNIFSMSKKMKFFFMLNFLSLGGLPPFLGFLPKWMTINNMINNKHYTLATLLIIFSLMSLYFYIRVTFSSFTIYSEESLIILFNNMNFYHFLMNLLSLLGLAGCSLVSSPM